MISHGTSNPVSSTLLAHHSRAEPKFSTPLLVLAKHNDMIKTHRRTLRHIDSTVGRIGSEVSNRLLYNKIDVTP